MACVRRCREGYIAVACLIVATGKVLQAAAFTLAEARTTHRESAAHDGTHLHLYSRQLQGAATPSARGSSDSPINSASCSLSIRGHAQDPGVHVVLDDKVTSDQGVVKASIICTTDPPGLLVHLGVNETWITPKMVAGFQGAMVVSNLGCQQRLAGRPQPMYGLVYFCGDYELTLDKLNVQGVHIHAPMPTGHADDLVTWQAAILVFGGNTQTLINQATVQRNSAGSPLAIANSAAVKISQHSEIGFNKAVWGGCALLMDGGQLTITGGSLLHDNSALDNGGAVQCSGSAQIVVQGQAVLSGNSARFYGGAVHALETCLVTLMEGTRVVNNNSTRYGGGIAVRNSGVVKVLGAKLEANTAEYGGGVAAQDSAQLISSNKSLFTRNNGQIGGAVAAQNMCNISFTGGSRLLRNTALYGGVIAMQENSVVAISGNSYFDGNGGDNSYGGAIAVQNSGQLYVEHSLFVNCFAFYGGVVVAQNTASVTLGPGSVFRNNTAWMGGVYAAIEDAALVVDNATMENNWAVSGGAVSVTNNASAVIKGGSVIRNNSAESGGGLIATLFGQVTLQACIFVDNHASAEGGGLHMSDNANLSILAKRTTGRAGAAPVAGTAESVAATYDTTIAKNTAKNIGGGVCIKQNNSLDLAALVAVTHRNKARYDHDVSMPLKAIQVVGPSYIIGVTSRLSPMLGTFDVTVKLSGPGGVPFGGSQVQITLGSDDTGPSLAEFTTNAAGMAVLSNIKLRERPGNYTLLVSSWIHKDASPAKVVVEVRHCVMGEVTNALNDACEPCSPGTYSLNPANISCDPCPAHASCPGGALLIPDEGFWHSSVSSPQMHACPNTKACSMNMTHLLICAAGNSSSTNRAKDPLAKACVPAPSPSADHQTETMAYLDLLCGPEYAGNLCGACKPGYGASHAFTCRPCLPRKTAAILYIIALLATLAFVRLLTHMTAVDNAASAAAAATAAAAYTPAPVPPPPPAGKQQQQQVTTGSGALPAAPGLPTPIPSVPTKMCSCASDTLPQMQPANRQHMLPGGCTSPMHKNDVDINTSQLLLPTRDQGMLPGSPTKGLQHHQLAPVPDGVPMHDVSHELSLTTEGGFLPTRQGLAASDVSMLITQVGRTDATLADATWAGKSALADLESPHAAAAAAANGGSHAVGCGTSLDLLPSGLSSGSVVSTPTAGGGAAVAAVGGGATGVPCGHGHVAQASDVLRDIVLYMQYMVLVGTLRVPWPKTLSLPMRALTWFWSAASSETLALECLMTREETSALPIALTRTLFYTAMPVAVYVVLLGIEAVVRLILVLALAFRHTKALHVMRPALRWFVQKQQQSRRCVPATLAGLIGLPPPAGGRAAFLHGLQFGFSGFGNNAWVLAGTTVFFFLPSVARYGLGLFVCVHLDDPNYDSYPWAAAVPGTYWLQDLNQQCWTGWHWYWAIFYGIPVVVLTCFALPVGIAVLIWRNKANLQEPWFIRKYGSLYRIFRPERAAWGAVVAMQTTALAGVTAFGLQLGPYHQTIAMFFAFAFTLVLLMLFKPLKHKQQHHLLVFGYACLFATTQAALTFMPSFDGTTPHGAYCLAMGACVLALNVTYLAYAIVQLKRSIAAEQLLSRLVSSLVSVLIKAAPLLPGSCVNSVNQKLARFNGNASSPVPNQQPANISGTGFTVP